MKVNNLKWIIALGVLALAVSACGGTNGTLTPPPTRSATQTPWIIYVPVTTTPEPAILPLLPTAEAKTTTVPTRAPTRAVVAKPSVVPTKPPSPAAVAAKPTAAPACNYGTVTLREPEDSAERHTRETEVNGDTFRFIWDPPESLLGSTDSTVGYQLNIVSKRPGFSNGATIYISNNTFLNSSPPKLFILDKPAVNTLAAGADVVVTWSVSIIKATGSFNESDPTARPPGLVVCGSPSPTRTINLKVY